MPTKYGYEPKRWNDRGKERWRIRVGTKSNGTAEYLPCKDEAHAKREQKKLLAKQAGDDVLGLEAIKTANQHGIAACVGKLAVVGATIEDATEWFLRTRFPAKGNCTATEAGNAYLAAKARANLGQVTRESYAEKIGVFMNYFGDTPVNEIKTEHLEKYFGEIGKAWSNNTMNPWKRFTVTFFNWLQDNEYIALPHGAKNAAEKMTIPKRDLHTPKIASWEEVHDMLYWYDRKANSVGGYKKGNVFGCMVYLVFCLFVGIRKSEAFQITWDDIDFEARTVSILVEGAKTNRRRVNDLPDNVWEWLAYLKQNGAKLNSAGDAQRRLIYRQRDYRESFTKRNASVPDIVAVELKLTRSGKSEPKEKYHNIMRHSFCGYHLKLHESAGKTALVMGNSEKKVRSDYHEVVKYKQDAEMYFNILPPETIARDENEGEEVTLEEAVKAKLLCDRLQPYIHTNETHCKAFQVAWAKVQEFPDYEAVCKASEWRELNVVYDGDGDPVAKEVALN